MAKCIRCGKSGIFLKVNAIGICKNCEYLYGKECQRQAYQKNNQNQFKSSCHKPINKNPIANTTQPPTLNADRHNTVNTCSQDLIYFSCSRICPYCSIYSKRIFSKSGTDKNFPSLLKLPFDLQGDKCPICDCYISFYSYFGYTIKDKKTVNADIKFSNRPFMDDRTNELKRYFEEKQAEKIALERDKADYDWLREHLPNIAPKSFSGYRRMRNLKSENYLKIVELAKENGYLIK